MKIKNIFFDFDGVLAESVSAKTEAFKEIYLPFGLNIAKKVVEHHINHGGISRFEKFKTYHKEFLNVDLSEAEVLEYSNKFSDLVLDKVVNSPEVNGAMSFLQKNYDKQKLFVITGTPTNEIKIILKRRNIDHFFIGSHGSPEKKRYWTEFLLNKYKLKRDATLFVGDATTDLDAAEFSRLHFALREHEENKEIFRNYTGPRFNDFTQFDELIKHYLS